MLPVGFVVMFFIPFAMPFMAWLGDDYWFPVVMILVLYSFVFQKLGNSEGGMAFIWHLAGLLIMAPLSVIIRVGRYLFG